MTDALSDPPSEPPSDGAGGKERMFNAPWPAVLIAAAILASYAVQTRAADQGLSLALFPDIVAAGHPAGLLTSLFLHGGWSHALMNAAFALAFGAPVARLLGLSAKGVIAFFIFYLLCGVLAGLAFVAVHPRGMEPVVGASGAVAGLMAAAARLMEGRAEPGSIFCRSALSLGAAWVIVNVLVAVTGLAPGVGEGGSIAWEAHLGGFLAGLLLIGPFHRFLVR